MSACTVPGCTCPVYNPIPPRWYLCATCGHSGPQHDIRLQPEGLHTPVFHPVSVKNTGDKVLAFGLDNTDETLQLAPGETKPLAPGNYRVEVEVVEPAPFANVIARIFFDHKLKKFDIQGENALEGARFVTIVDLEAEAVGILPADG